MHALYSHFRYVGGQNSARLARLVKSDTLDTTWIYEAAQLQQNSGEVGGFKRPLRVTGGAIPRLLEDT